MKNKKCGRCKHIKKLTEFKSHKRDGHQSYCSKCQELYMDAYNLKKRYGMTIDEYKKMLKDQDNVCKICKKPCLIKKKLSVDHCHKSGKIRGLLCSNCNAALGLFKDNSERIIEAANYLIEASQKETTASTNTAVVPGRNAESKSRAT